jgi:hypothetical protein
MSEFDKFKAAVYGQESGNGAVDTSQPNYAGARGKGQILESTFKGLQKQGAIPADYSWSNPAHNEVAAEAYMKEAWAAAGQDPRRAAAYYYGGPKAIKGGGIVSFGDTKNAAAPTTVQYADQVATRMGLAPAATAPVAGPSRMELAIRNSVLRVPAMPTEAEYQTENEAAIAYEQARPDLATQFGAAMHGGTDARIFGPLHEAIWGPKFTPVAGYKPDFTLLKGVGADSDLIEEYGNARSPEEAAKAISDFQEEAKRNEIISDRGAIRGFLVQGGVELASPTNWLAAITVPHLLAARGVGSVALAARGASRAQVIGSSIAENIASGTALEATAQLAQGRFNGTDLLISAVADSTLGAIAGTLTKSAARSGQYASIERMVQRMADTATEQEAAAVARAQAKLGGTATTEQVVAAVEAERLADTLHPMRQAAVADGGLNTVAQQDLPTGVTPEAAPIEADFDSLEKLVGRKEEFLPGGKYEVEIGTRTGGMVATLRGLEKLSTGVHVTPTLALQHRAAMDTVGRLAKRFLKDTTLVIHSADIPMPDGKFANADIMQVTEKLAIVRLSPSLTASEAVRSAVHEVGHAIFNRHIAALAPEAKTKLLLAFNSFLAVAKRGTPDGNEARAMRYSTTNPSLLPDRELTTPLTSDYELDWDEFSAEQFGKYLEEDAATDNKFGLHANVVRMIKAAIHNALAWLKFAKRENLGVTDEYREFFETLANDPAIAQARGTLRLPKLAQPDTPAQVTNSILTDPDANRFGLGTIPVGTKTERDDAKAILALHKQAEQDAPVMTPKYIENVKNLADNSVFNVASTGLTMLKSQSPLVRWVASQLLEDASGVQAKRGTTAAIKKHLMERLMMGNTINDIDSAYSFWKKGKPGGWQDDMIGGKNRAEFDRLMAEEIEARRSAKAPVSTDGNVKVAVDSIEAAYTRTAKAQVDAKTLGSEGLPTTSVGYMPHRMSAKAVLNLTNEKREIVHQALTDQFINIEGWDASFSDMLASKYMQRVLDRATGGNSSTLGGNSSSSVDLIEEALNNMQLPTDQIAKHMANFKKGAANFTKGRIELDLNKSYPTAQGDFKLLDIFETNQIELLRSQVQRASGDVALALKGVQGKPGLTLLRKAMQFGEDGKKATNQELEAFDQIAAELMGEPFGTATPRWMERAMSANTLVRLGGIVYNQISESINGIVHVGAMRVLESVTGIPRLRQEILALARGEKVDNSIIGSIELAGGAEFGTDAYKIVMPFDNPSNTMPTYGQDTLTLTDRLLRGGGHVQAKLSGWRAIHSAQQRGMAEQIVHKTLRYIREGKDDIALQQFGITPELQQAMRAELGTIARFDGDRLVEFDVTKMTDPAMREQLIQAVWRGTSQIIQGTYIGERGKWAHDGTLKLLTQFRTFSITSMEKQWGRQRNSRGAFATFGIIMGAMSLAMPIYMARTYASSIGRPDQAEYLEERFQPQHIARATMNYVANLGLAPDMIDGLSAMLPESMGIKATGGRAGVETDFVGNYVAPAFSLVDDVWKYAQSPLEMDDAARILPLRNLPYLVPLMNLTKE